MKAITTGRKGEHFLDSENAAQAESESLFQPFSRGLGESRTLPAKKKRGKKLDVYSLPSVGV